MYLKDKSDYKKLQKEAFKEIGIWSLWLIPSLVVVLFVWMIVNLNRFPLTNQDLQDIMSKESILFYNRLGNVLIYKTETQAGDHMIHFFDAFSLLNRFNHSNTVRYIPNSFSEQGSSMVGFGDMSGRSFVYVIDDASIILDPIEHWSDFMQSNLFRLLSITISIGSIAHNIHHRYRKKKELA